MVRFSSVPGDQRLLLIRCHFKTMPVYGAKVRTLIHTRVFLNNRKPSTCTDNCPWGKRALRGRVNSARFPRRSATLMLNAGTMTH